VKASDTLWIIGGGLSVARYVHLVKGDSLGINQAGFYFPVDYCFWMDRQWYDKNREKVHRYPFAKWTCDMQPYPEDVNQLEVQVKSSGAGALYLALRLGYKKIYLLGYDHCSQGGKSHWHDDYTRITLSPQSYERWLPDYYAIKLMADQAGVQIWNTNPHSRLTVFPTFVNS
jgi:hypothetical protein